MTRDGRSEGDGRGDGELLRAAARGDEGAFEALYERHARFVHAVARRHAGADLAADVVQETFAWLVQRMPRIELAGRLSTLLYPVIVHTAAALQRKARRADAHADLLHDLPAPPEGDDVGEDLRAALASLPGAQAEVVILRFTDGMSMEEIAQALDVPVGTVKSRLHHALASLREHPRTRRHHPE